MLIIISLSFFKVMFTIYKQEQIVFTTHLFMSPVNFGDDNNVIILILFLTLNVAYYLKINYKCSEIHMWHHCVVNYFNIFLQILITRF